MPPELVIIFAIGEFHCSSLCFFVPRFSASFEGGEERKVTMPKNILVTAKVRRGRSRENLFGRYANAYANMVDGLSFVKWLAHAVSLISFLTRVITFISSKNVPDSW